MSGMQLDAKTAERVAKIAHRDSSDPMTILVAAVKIYEVMPSEFIERILQASAVDGGEGALVEFWGAIDFAVARLNYGQS